MCQTTESSGIPSENTFQLVRAWVESHIDKGIKCPACSVESRRYRVRMNKVYVHTLTLLAAIAGDKGDYEGWFKVGQRELGKELAHDLNHLKYSKLRYWGLIEKRTHGHNRQSLAGYWRVTPTGYAFLAGKIRVPAWVKELRAKPVALSAETVDVHQATKGHFDFDEEVLGVRACGAK